MSIYGFYENNNRIHIGQDARIDKSEKAIFDSYFCFSCFFERKNELFEYGEAGGIFREKLSSSFWQSFDYFEFNKHLVETYCSGHKIIATDCSYIPKSGKETPDIGNFWSGCASKALKGLEISSLAVIDVDNNTGMHLECKQTTESSIDEESRVDFYLQQVIDKKDELKQLADYIVADGAYAKQKYVDGLLEKTGCI